MAYSPINPTQLTPPRVAFIDERSGAISREWYRFFLSLLTATQQNQDAADLTPDTDSLLASYDAVFSDAIQALESTPDCCSETASLDAKVDTLTQNAAIQPDATSNAVSLDSKFDSITQGLAVGPRAELGTMAALQQANVPWLTFNIAPTPVPTAVGSMYWDGGTTMGVQATASVLIRVGEAEYVYVKASSAVTKGQLCYHTGAVGASGVITVAPTPLALTDPNQIVGVAAETIALNGFGLIQISGDLRGFNTTGSSVGETWADGDPLYYNPAYVGSFTKTKPSAPNQKTYIGEVTNAGSGASGSIHIRIVPGSVLGGTDSNVQFGTLANGDLIQYDSALQYWKNVTASSVIAGSGGAPVTKTADFTVAAGENWIINNKSGSTCTATLPSASANTGRAITFQNYQDQYLVSASSNVVPRAGGAAGTAILDNVAGNWATLVSNGTNWVIMQAAPFNCMLI